MTDVRFSCVLHETHWFVEQHGVDVVGFRFALQAVCTTDQAAALTKAQTLGADCDEVRILRCDTVFLPRCVVCGCDLDDRYRPRQSWEDCADDLSFAPGWLATPELLVYCPTHRPDKER
jgi:hypothetical protein